MKVSCHTKFRFAEREAQCILGEYGPLSIASGKHRDISSHLSSQVTATIERNRHILKAIVDVIVLCGQHNIAIRGHVERTSNFHSLLQFRAKTDPVLALHLQNDDNRAKYTSPRIQNELIDLCGD